MIITKKKFEALTALEMDKLLKKFNEEVYPKFSKDDKYIYFTYEDGKKRAEGTVAEYNKHPQKVVDRSDLMTLEEEIAEAKAGRLPYKYNEETNEFVF